MNTRFFHRKAGVQVALCMALAALLTSPLHADGFTVGAPVKCKWQKIGNYYTGKIARRNGNTVFIQYDDGDTETTEIQYCKLIDPNQTKPARNNQNNQNNNQDSSNIKKLEARSSGSDNWQDWSISLAGGKGRLKANGTGQHMSWDIELPGRDVKVLTCIQGSQWWTKWQYRYGGNQLIAEASSLTEWKIDSTYNRLKVRTRWSGDTDQWIVSGKKGEMKVTRNGGSWPSWEIEDNMPGEDFHMKMAAIFAIIVATEMPH
ncbi:MAG: hypothetical protein CMN76_19980 [Spirochaetaceae bacterium]|nr:hypothetical protein [Spirochaetaceae bacterium]|tara:strand:- start:59730 stop:60509 length:780 start_codon:yes stop_codon:yes gene_type:complete